MRLDLSKTSAPHPSAGGHLRELTICAGTSTWTPVGIVSNRFCAAANAAADSRVAAESGTVGASLCARSGSSRRLALMRSIVARSQSRCSAFSSSSEPGCLWLLVVAAAPAAPVGQLSQTGRACRGGILLCSACTHGRREFVVAGVVVHLPQRAHVSVLSHMQYGSRYVAERLMNTAKNGSTALWALEARGDWSCACTTQPA